MTIAVHAVALLAPCGLRRRRNVAVEHQWIGGALKQESACVWCFGLDSDSFSVQPVRRHPGSAPPEGRARPARIIWRLSTLRRLIWPSVWLLLHGELRAASTVAQSRPIPAANERISGRLRASAWSSQAIKPGASRPHTSVPKSMASCRTSQMASSAPRRAIRYARSSAQHPIHRLVHPATQRRRATIRPQRGIGVDTIHLFPHTLHSASPLHELVWFARRASHSGGMPLVSRRQFAGTFIGSRWRR